MAAYPEHISMAAHQTLVDFSEKVPNFETEECRQKGERIARTLHLFASNRLPEPAYDAAFLLPLARSVQASHDSPQESAAAWSLGDYLTNPDYDENISAEVNAYIADVWGDFQTIDEAIFDYQDRIRSHDSELGRHVLHVLAVDAGEPIPAEHWQRAAAGVNVPKIRAVTHEVNVESVIIGAAELLDDITHEQDSRKQMHLVFVAETFYCPALEAFGMWAMDTALRNAVNTIRLTNAGRADLIDKANEVLAPVKKIGQERVLEELLGTTLSDETTRFHLNGETPYGTSVHFVDADVEREGFEKGVRIISRIKASKSLAMKMLQNPDYRSRTPSDIVGMTAIVEGEAQLAEFFNHIVSRVETLENCRFQVAASKSQPLYVKGGADFVASLKEKLRPDILDTVEFRANDESTSAFQVAKMTFSMTLDGVEIPIEFQFQTEKDRERAETGDSPHFIQKTKKIPEDMPGNVPGEPNDLADIRNRKRTWLGLDKTIIVVGNNGQRFADTLYNKMQ